MKTPKTLLIGTVVVGAAIIAVGVVVSFGGTSPANLEPPKTLEIQPAQPAQSPDTPSLQPTASSSSTLPTTALSLSSTRDVEIDFKEFRQLLPRDAIVPIYEPQFLPAEQATLDPEELVLGVEINGESKAYPIGPLNRREMVNDVVGGVPILVTW